MRLQIVKSKNAQSLYVIKSFRENGKNTSKVVEKLGTYAGLQEKLGGEDPIAWAKKYIEELNEKEKEDKNDVLMKFSSAKRIPKDVQQSFNGGYLFLQKIYHELGLHKLCYEISNRYEFSFSLNSILSRLIYSRLIYPSSKLATCELSKRFLEQPDFELHQIYRALGVLAKESDFLQQAVYKNSLHLMRRRTGVIYYDCTNYFFEAEQASGDRQYGQSKEHRPNPIVQMGLFMDSDGIPLAFSMNPGNTNEQVTLKPLEEKLLSDFKLSKFVVCTDAGLSSLANRKFNDKGGRGFITTQSLKKLKKHLLKDALSPEKWYISGNRTPMNLEACMQEEDFVTRHKDTIFYKEIWMNEDGLEQKLIVTFSQKYKDYQARLRNEQVQRAAKLAETPSKLKKRNANDCRRFIQTEHCTDDGEAAAHDIIGLDNAKIANEARFDGYYAVCTNLEDPASKIIRINQRRWEIEECFRIMKSEFKARPVYLSRDDRIQAHFLVCFLTLQIYRILEKRLGGQLTCTEIVHTLRDMNFLKISGDGYIPTFTRTDLTDSLHENFNFRTDYQILSNQMFKKIFKASKS